MAVSSTKDKLVEEAQKLVMRGQFDKAAKVYEQVLTLDPSAINQRQKLAEILIKAGRTDDARKEFETIGKHFSDNGFYLKSIAVYKQLQKLFPGDLTLSLTLAGLNEKHGLTANALSEYKRVYDFYEKQGNTSETLKILDNMQAVDPQNVTVKIKMAEACFQNGKKDDAYALFVKAAFLLQDKGDNAAVLKLNARILELFPDKSEFMLEVLAGHIMSGNAATALNVLQGLIRSYPQDRRLWDLIVEAFKRLGQSQRVKAAYQHYHKMLPDEPAPMAGLIYCCVEDRDVKGALELLDLYEKKMQSARMFGDLETLYRALAEIDPINIKVLEGLMRALRATGTVNGGEITQLSEKLKSLSKVSGDDPPGPVVPEPGPEEIELYDLSSLAESYIEIELDVDDDSVLGSSTEKVVGDVLDNNDWLDSVGHLFDTISTAPSGVRFGSEMESSDAQSHFDLGLAFKEMGLYDEAINEFRKASSDSARRIACLIMQGACLRERGEFDTAIKMLNSLMKPGLSRDDSCAVKYELILAYECAGKTDDAARLLKEIDSANPDFRDVSTRLNAANLENLLDFSDEELKNF